MMGNN